MGGGAGKMDFHEYNPTNDSWTQKADIPGVTQSRAFAVGVTINGKGYVGLGGDNNNTVLKKDWWEYNPATDKWTQKADFIGAARDGSAYFVVNNKAYIVGGTNNMVLFNDLYEYDPATDTWTQPNTTYPAGAIVFGTGFSIGNFGYVTCGSGLSELTATYQLDPQNYTWRRMADFTGTPRQTAVGFAIGSLGFVGSGQKGYSQVFKDFFSFDPIADIWKPVGDISDKGRSWACAATVNGKAYIGTGWDFGASFFNDWWEFIPQTTVGVNEIASAKPIIYTNIINSTLEIDFSSDETRVLNIISIEGKTLSTQTFNTANVSISTATLSAGIYILETKSSTISSKQKFIVR